jgi:hypothetical protein
MVGCTLSRFLHVIYPALVMGFALMTLSSSSLSDVRMTPPVGDGFNLFWNPMLSTQNTCNREEIHQLNRSCSASGGFRSIEQLSNNQNLNMNQTN